MLRSYLLCVVLSALCISHVLAKCQCMLCDAAVNCMIWECGEAHKVELSVVDVGWKIVERVDFLMSEQPCTYFILGSIFSLALMLLPVAYRVYHSKDQLESLNYQALEGIHTAAQLAFGHNWRYGAFSVSRYFLTVAVAFNAFVLFSRQKYRCGSCSVAKAQS